nr:MAG TPA: hypothetical protein [Caudoviricetes sp.]
MFFHYKKIFSIFLLTNVENSCIIICERTF